MGGMMLRNSWLLAVPLVLTGCGLPPAITFTSYAIDGLSFLTTGKTASDHAISEVAQRDCSPM